MTESTEPTEPTLNYDPTTLARGRLMRRCGDQGIDWSGWGLYAYVGVSRCGDYLRVRRVATCRSVNKSVTLLPACALWPVSGRINLETK